MIFSVLIITETGLGKRYNRWLRLESFGAESPIKLSTSQISFIEKQNPQFKEPHVESSNPVELINQDTFYAGRIKALAKHMHVAQSPKINAFLAATGWNLNKLMEKLEDKFFYSYKIYIWF